MTYETYELSADQGAPVRLYEFRRGQIYYRYTSAGRDITWDAKTWETVEGGIADGGISASGVSEQDRLTVNAPWSLPVVELFRGTPPSDPVSLKVRRLHLDDPDQEAVIVWVGLITERATQKEGLAQLKCESMLYLLQKGGLRLLYGRGCTHFLYDDGCRVNKASFAVAATVTALTGTTVSATAISAYADGHFSGGFIEWDLDMLGTKERRPVEDHAGGVLTLLGLTDGMTVAMDIVVYPGCALDIGTCETKFNNLLNFGGFPHMPNKDPLRDGVLQSLPDKTEKKKKIKKVRTNPQGTGTLGGTSGLENDGTSVPYDGGYTSGEGG